MEIHFAKWHGTGNDFIVIDDRRSEFPADDLTVVQRLCDRHFGIGSDGLILIQPPKQAGTSFHMEFFNPDGSRSFCGNGSRCAYAFWCGLTGDRSVAKFTAIATNMFSSEHNLHAGEWIGDQVAITLPYVGIVDHGIDGPQVDFINTGSPHYLVWVPDVQAVDILADAPPRRRSVKYGPGGCNVNYVQATDGALRMRTFERGVEAETLSCGSGVVAAALSALYRHVAQSPVAVSAPGGELRVEAVRVDREGFDHIRLIGPAVEVYKGTITI
jgi:diaminopimelate epimerase